MAKTTAIDTCVLNWSCADETNLVAAVIRQCLDTWHASSQTHHQRIVIDHPNEVNQLGLAVWSVTKQTQLTAICSLIENQRRNNPQIFQLAFLVGDLAEYQGLLIEAGASFVVVDQIWQLQTVLMKVVDRLQVSREGHHPLTSGLLNRLPWK